MASHAGRPQTLKRISEVWVPELQRMEVEVPFLLVGCKSDIRQQGQTLQQVGQSFCCITALGVHKVAIGNMVPWIMSTWSCIMSSMSKCASANADGCAYHEQVQAH